MFGKAIFVVRSMRRLRSCGLFQGYVPEEWSRYVFELRNESIVELKRLQHQTSPSICVGNKCVDQLLCAPGRSPMRVIYDEIDRQRLRSLQAELGKGKAIFGGDADRAPEKWKIPCYFTPAATDARYQKGERGERSRGFLRVTNSKDRCEKLVRKILDMEPPWWFPDTLFHSQKIKNVIC
ncbi:hypothetical protein SERLA73DRAFT_182644 [Serpula lacrymans var. lacrymans S7.3]|uniref:Uncharacterized protein n=2 Tax=Serpula lacrymans var. lacrymans TaxID=341189 RepID=F8Q0Q1_SERL3|nr:uncharacterized protein SERLADRAFT_469391 [Serpula lacrymans var. lacrymans S7.9]EGN97880.1 hypothetical protein SERLA73DRAFT_182644 [Serpula lacrymans var. lacrymans S7.3]EGO23459.1 hypothetical protein SERLADRAFT_469391 [Serpula lacrymans var. lacrymans S7.9]